MSYNSGCGFVLFSKGNVVWYMRWPHAGKVGGLHLQIIWRLRIEAIIGTALCALAARAGCALVVALNTGDSG